MNVIPAGRVPARYDEGRRSQAVAAYRVAGGYAKGKAILRALWGVDDEELPPKSTVQDWVARMPQVEPQHLQEAERIYRHLYLTSLIELQEDVVQAVRRKLEDPKEKLFNVNGTLKILGDMINPILNPKAPGYYVDARGALFVTKKDRKSKLIDGQLVGPARTEGD